MIVVIGLGAIGSIYAVALQSAGIDVKIAVDSDRLNRYNGKPITFNGKNYIFDYFTPKVGDKPAELIIIATKWLGYNDALDIIAPIVGDKTIIMPLLNGINSEEVAIEKFGNKVLYSYFIGHTATRVNKNIVQDGQYRTVFGEKTNDLKNLSERVQRVIKTFDKANIKYRIDENIISSLWQKFVINIGLNQITGLLNKNYGEIQQDVKAKELMRNLMLEAQNIAVAMHVNGAENFVETGLDTLNKMEGSDSSSMLQDVQAGRKTEVEIFAGEVCRLGRKLKIPTPYNDMILTKLK